jgi:septin family protein
MKPVVAALKPREVSYVGFGNIPNQVFRRAVKLGFDFTLMVVGMITMDSSNVHEMCAQVKAASASRRSSIRCSCRTFANRRVHRRRRT